MNISNKEMEKTQKETKKNKNINELTNQLKKNINEDFNFSYQELTKNKNEIKKKDIEKWKNNILIKINLEIDKFIEQIKGGENVNEQKNKNEYKMESNSELNMFTPKDIQEENKEINYLGGNEKIENEKVAHFLKDVGIISRISYKKSNLLCNIMKEKFLKLKGNSKKSFGNENTIKEFSCWIKKFENEKKEKNEYQNFFNSIKLFDKEEKNVTQEFLKKLFCDLTLMYFHCSISLPRVEINFKIKDDFNSDNMIDFINRGKNRKVNFVILPSLFSLGNYLQNGKSWVFTYSKDTFKFEDSINNFLNNYLIQEEDLALIENIKKKFVMKVYCKITGKGKEIIIDTNMDIPENIDYEFHFYLYNRTTNQIFIKKIKQKNFQIDNIYFIEKYEFFLLNELIISRNDITLI